MNVCIIELDQLRRFDKRYQIMAPVTCGFSRLGSSDLLTLGEAQRICAERGYSVLKIGNSWQCADCTL